MKNSSVTPLVIRRSQIVSARQAIDMLNFYSIIVGMITHCRLICHSYFYALEA